MTRHREQVGRQCAFLRGFAEDEFHEIADTLEVLEADLTLALAAATGTAKTPQAVECEASQSGPKGNAQTNSTERTGGRLNKPLPTDK